MSILVMPQTAAMPTTPNGGAAATPNGSAEFCPTPRPSASLPAREAGSRRNETPARRKLNLESHRDSIDSANSLQTSYDAISHNVTISICRKALSFGSS